MSPATIAASPTRSRRCAEAGRIKGDKIMDLGILVPIIAVMIPLVVVSRRPLQRWLEHKERCMELEAKRADDHAALAAARTERLEQRVAVLERILTDRSSRLDDEIERLRAAPIN